VQAHNIVGIALLILATLFLPYFFWHIFRILLNPKPDEREHGLVRIVGTVLAAVMALIVGRFLIGIWLMILHRH
jgi:hypothetical protein